MGRRKVWFVFLIVFLYNQSMTTRRWSDDTLRKSVQDSFTFKDTMLALGLKPGGGNEALVRKRIKDLDLDTSHFRKGGYGVYKHEIDSLFRDGINFHTGHRRWILKCKEYKCEECGIFEWGGKPITLQVDHVDGNRKNNTLDNLRLLCPNCHSQTETWGSKNKRRHKQ